MPDVIDLSKWRRLKTLQRKSDIKTSHRDNKSTVEILKIDGVEVKPHTSDEERIAKIKATTKRIDDLLEELKRLSITKDET